MDYFWNLVISVLDVGMKGFWPWHMLDGLNVKVDGITQVFPCCPLRSWMA